MTSQQWNTSSTVQGASYMSRAKATTEFGANNPTAAIRQSRSNPRFQDYEQPSPGGSSYSTADPYSPTVNNGYVPDSEVSSVTGSVGSFAISRQPLAVHKMPARYNAESGDSGNYSSQRARSYASSVTSYGETDLDSVVSDNRRPTNNARFQGELFQPQPAPRTMLVEKQVRSMYGEKHPSKLTSDELPTPSSGDELESATTASEASVPSFAGAPKVRPRSSLRRKKLSEANSAFFSDDDSVDSNLDKSKSLPRSILKSNNTDISDAESLAKSSNFSRTGSRRSVRFEHRDKAKDIAKKVTDYSKIDTEDSGKDKKRKKSDLFDHIAPIGIKSARNDPKRSSGRSNSSRGSQRGRQARSSSSDRSRQKSSNGSAARSRSVSPGRGQRSSSVDSTKKKPQSNGHTRPEDEYSAALRGDDVHIEMPSSNKNKSMMGEILSQPRPSTSGSGTDVQKICKWCLIIGVPVVLIIVVIAVVVAVLGGG